MKYKKLLITLGVLLGVIFMCIILSFTLFRLKKVTIDFKNETTIYASDESKEAIIRTGGFSYNMPIFNVNKNAVKERLEKENFYLKVINIETVFPNKIVVHCAQREELFAIKISDSLHYVCDDELKVLSMLTNTAMYESTNNNAVLLNGVDVLNKSAKLGEKLSIEGNEDIVKNISTAFAYNNRTISDIKGMFKSITVKRDKNDLYTKRVETYLVLTTFDDFEITLGLARCNLVEKINLMLSIIPQSQDKIGEYNLIIELDPDNTANTYIRYEKIQTDNNPDDGD